MRSFARFTLCLIGGITFIWRVSFSQNAPSIDSLNQQMSELERLLGVPVEQGDKTERPQTLPAEELTLLPVVNTPPEVKVSVLPESLQGIEKKLEELEAMVGDLPAEEIFSEVTDDPWLNKDLNSTLNSEDLPKVELSSGMAVRYVPSSGGFLPLNEGEFIKMKTLIVVPTGSELAISFKGKSAIRLGEDTRTVIGPPEGNKQIIDLRKGTVSAYISPDRDSSSFLKFAIKTRSGLIEAKGTFYAVTEYNGQTYTAIKHGKIKKEPKVPEKSNFAAYVKKSSSKKPLKPAEKNSNN